jgi:hypothetical protein
MKKLVGLIAYCNKKKSTIKSAKLLSCCVNKKGCPYWSLRKGY